MDSNTFFTMLGEAILYSSIQFSIGSVMMSSTFSVKNFSTDQTTLQNAMDSLSEFLKIALLWTLGVTMLLYGKYGFRGLISSLVANLPVVVWIYLSYISAFNYAIDKAKSKGVNLVMPTLYFLVPSAGSMS